MQKLQMSIIVDNHVPQAKPINLLYFQDQPTTRHLSSFSSLDNPRGRQIQKAPLRTKSMLAAFFVKHRSAKMKNVSVR